MAHHGDVRGLCWCLMEFPYNSYGTKPTVWEFSILTRTKIGVFLLRLAEPESHQIKRRPCAGFVLDSMRQLKPTFSQNTPKARAAPHS